MRLEIPWLRPLSFKRKLFLYSIVISLIPVILVGNFSSLIAADMIQTEIDRNHQLILKEVETQVDAFWSAMDKASIQLSNHQVLEQSVTAGPSAKTFDLMHEMVDVIQKQRSVSTVPYDVSIIFLQYGKVYHTKLGFIDLAEFPYRSVVDRIPPYFRSEMFPPNTYPGQEELLFLRPVPLFSDSRGNGILMLHIHKDKLESFAAHAPLGGGRKLYVFDEKGTVLISGVGTEIGNRQDPLFSELNKWKENHVNEVMWNGERYQMTSHYSLANRWTYLALTPKEELTRQANWIQTLTWGVIVLFATVWVYVAKMGSVRLYGPLQRLLHRAGATGKPEMPFTGDEWSTLGSWADHIVKTNESLHRKLQEQTPYIKETFVQQLLRGEISNHEFGEKQRALGIELPGPRYAVILVEVDDYGSFQSEYREKDRSLMMYALRKLSEEHFSDRFPSLSCISMPGQIALIVCLAQGEEPWNELLQTAEWLRETTRQHFQFTVTIACSTPVLTFKQCSDAYQDARELLGYRLLTGHGQLLTPEKVEPSVKQFGSELVKGERQIIDAVLQGDTQKASSSLRLWVDEISMHAANAEAVLGQLAHLIGELIIQLQERGLNPAEAFGDDPYRRLYSATSLHELCLWLETALFPEIAARMDELLIDKQERIAGDMIRYIQRQYDTDISLQAMSEQFGLSSSQLSRMFKEKTGMNFIDYLIEYRMERAKEWLAQTDMPIKEIAGRLRYTSVPNFTRIFKQIVHLPPGEYRKQQRQP
ncbi:helix-turn-helix domain-containing protein [Paenibacillus sp. GD4]|jgi:two-component system, response regulator YesN|uniref:helix-turn-helix domain-containing protein n=1 Tax=Paenibacillus sp. GD4 TaxID=3068890 RepID=UPI002796B983|nr:helix-turn-helix domain-containing protein [Paenibacillus sp. GD4]MDQ1913516.1 helix-turn-helix domain-containing protein [Paenibacillus sp. GD4]